MYLAKGGNLKKMIAELYGKATGVAKGKGGSMHLIEPDAGVMGTSAVVGTTIPQAVGYAYALKVRKSKSVVVNFFGDGAVEEGVFHESLNFAALKQLPIIFICENNLYAIHSHQRDRQADTQICPRVATYGIPTKKVEDGDIIKLHDLVKAAVNDIRSGKSGPMFFECMCYRWMEHVGPNEDFTAGYRSVEEAQPWYENDQVQLIGNQLESSQRQSIEAEVEAEIKEAFEFAERSPFPGDSELYTDLFEGE
jgi:TPP-dependent pyruvate/acetoin dehydrogenase alpha subunit